MWYCRSPTGRATRWSAFGKDRPSLVMATLGARLGRDYAGRTGPSSTPDGVSAPWGCGRDSRDRACRNLKHAQRDPTWRERAVARDRARGHFDAGGARADTATGASAFTGAPPGLRDAAAH